MTTNSEALLSRARTVIPHGIYGHYRGALGDNRPCFFESSGGSRFTDVDGNTYIDWVCAYGPMILGYNHPAVEHAASQQAAKGNTVSLAAPVMIELAETLVDMVQGAQWALFGKNGADATVLAVMIARAATGRRMVVKIDGGYHGTAAWMQAPGSPGTIDEDQSLVISIPWNDLDALRDAISRHGADIAAFISSPYHHPVRAENALPADGYWPSVEQLCRDAGIVTIVDDVRAGFRIDLAGSHAAYGFQPDLMCLGKALGNGHPISALLGADALRPAAEDTFYTGTQFFNAAPMAAALATIRELAAVDAANVITEIGNRLNRGLVDVAAAHGHNLLVSGVPGMPFYRIDGEGGGALLKRWVAECSRRGAYLLSYHNNFVSAAHTDTDLEETWAIADDAFRAIGGRP
jgi:glutamate-1-semialdehyde 2,1-aminomutase